MAKLTQAELEAQLIAQQQAEARSMITIVKALIANQLQVHEVDFDALAQKVSNINTLLDGDEASEGYQAFAALTTKLNQVELKGHANEAAITAFQTAVNAQIAALTTRVEDVESEARTGREALDARITQLRTEYEQHVADKLASDNAQNTKLDDHLARIEALEASKLLVEGRLATLEGDNTANKSAIAGIQTTLQAQAEALQQELTRAQTVEAEIRAELATERARTDAVVTKQEEFATREDVANAGKAAAMAAVSAAWDESGIPMPAGLAMPDGSVSQ